MKTKAFYTVLLFLMLCLSCESQSNYQNNNAGSSIDQWRFHNLVNASSNEVVAQLPLPAGWQVVGPRGAGQVYITAPGQVSVTSLPYESYFYDVHPTQVQAIQMQGKQIANPVSLQRIVQEHLAPQIQQQGGRLTNQYPLPELLDLDRRLTELNVRAHGFQFQGEDMLVTEWTAPDGTKSLILLTQFQMRSQMGFSIWQLYIEELEAPASSFEEARNIYLKALLNRRVDEQKIIASGQRKYQEHQAGMARDRAVWNERSRRSATAHQNRMAEREAAFQASQARHRETVNAISDMSMQGYWERSAAQDRMQDNTVNMIHEENTVVNPYTGKPMQVEQGYSRTFVDPYGNYYQTNDQFFNPQQHPEFQYFKEVKKQN